MGQAKIKWADASWNPITGCTPISAGCAHCYARPIEIYSPMIQPRLPLEREEDEDFDEIPEM